MTQAVHTLPAFTMAGGGYGASRAREGGLVGRGCWREKGEGARQVLRQSCAVCGAVHWGVPEAPAFCLVTEYLAGGTLRKHLQAVAPRRLPLRQALQMALDIARGMDYLHSQVSVHDAFPLPPARAPRTAFATGHTGKGRGASGQ